ncbi:hypothetical protein BDN67DRAFT_908453 [Paxillus ammoniavirescens]|nr:hypothetical protein BDN67DRAFT_908453 [Paxillus ammoniavirescens]
MLEAFKIKEFDLNPIFEAWANPPMFYGESKKDMPVDDWLNQIKAGCVERKVPEEYWHKVAQHYMGEKAKGRLTELKNVMAQVNGGKYRWSWKKFKIAMKNMGWNIDVTATTPVTVQRRSSGSFWLTRRRSSKGQVSKDAEIVEVARVEAPLPPPKESRPNPVKMFSESAIIAATSAFKSRHSPQRSNTVGPAVTTTSAFASAPIVTPLPPLPPLPIATQPTPENNAPVVCIAIHTTFRVPTAVTTVSNVPTWLLNACHALDFLTTEHPRAMTTLSAVLITAGTLPAIPAISGGTVLASGVAQAVGAIAVGVGNLLKAQQEGQIQVSGQTPAQAPAGFHPPMRAATFQ